ncbi:MAG TPA: hypothetical protein G4O02_02255 [Caldilineae bacterium]|nr:hypothetical protein [Caldilineae bacterium]
MAKRRRQAPLMLLGLLTLLVGMWAGLARLGWGVPGWRTLSIAHGPLMVPGFLGTLIGLERAIALQTMLGSGLWRRWPYLAPLLNALGALSLIAGVPGPVSPLLMTLGSLVMVIIFLVLIRRHAVLPIAIMTLGAVAWLMGNALWLLGRPLSLAAFWWAGTLVLTIAGERLELSRLRRPSRWATRSFLAAVGIVSIGLILTIPAFAVGIRLVGAGMLILALWLLWYDMARRLVRGIGQTRFTAASLLSGYVWLGVGGLLALLYGGATAGPRYDAMLHAVFLGFVMAMIFGHAPIIFPALLRISVSFRSAFYGHLGLLHLSLLMRIVGDLAGWWAGRQWGGLLNVVAVLFFLANMIAATREEGMG